MAGLAWIAGIGPYSQAEFGFERLAFRFCFGCAFALPSYVLSSLLSVHAVCKPHDVRGVGALYVMLLRIPERGEAHENILDHTFEWLLS